MKFGSWLVAGYFAFSGLAGLAAHSAVAADAPVSQIPFKRDNISTASDAPRVALGLTVCFLLLAGAVYVIRRRLGPTLETGRVKRLRVLESHRLSPRSSLHVVEFAGKVHLLAQSEQGIHCLVSTPVGSSSSLEQHG
jgi:flagellar biogenesis protein FliO